MATDSVTIDRRQARQPRRDPARKPPEIRSPAAPIARGMGLDEPFFDDKNRAFWILQSIGWTGYFVLRTISGFANSMGWIWLVHTLLLTLTGYSLTLLMASLFRRLIKTRPLWTLVFSLAIVVFASVAFSVIETWSNATFVHPGSKPVGIEYFGAILLNFRCSPRGPRFTTGSIITSCSRNRSDSAKSWRVRPRPPSWRCCATN